MCNKAGGTWRLVLWECRAWHELRDSRKLKILLSIRKHLINEYEHATISSVPRTWADSMRDRVQLFYTCLAFQRTSMILETSRERRRERESARSAESASETCCKPKLAVRSRAFKNTIYTVYTFGIWQYGGTRLIAQFVFCVIFRFLFSSLFFAIFLFFFLHFL